MTVNSISLVLFFVLTSQLMAEDWPQWMGPNRDAIWTADGIIEKFPESGANVSWSQSAGLGYAGPAVVGDSVYLFDYLTSEGDLTPSPSARNTIQGQERIRCLDAMTGQEQWKYEYDCPYYISYPSGPRCTPTVDGSYVYAYGAEGHLTCLNKDNGKLVWQMDVKQEFDIKESPLWGFASHPLIFENSIIILAGGEGSVVVCLDKLNGKRNWTSLSAKEPGYCPASVLQSGGKTQILIWHAEAIHGLNPQTGRSEWDVPLKPEYGMSIMSPRKSGHYLFASGIGAVGALIELNQGLSNADVVWSGTNRTALYAANSTPFIQDGVIYGCDCRPGIFRAVDLKTGKRLWQSTEVITGERPKPHATAFIVKHQDRFFLFTETGDLVIANLTRDAYEEISRVNILNPTSDAFGRPVVWSHPAFANKTCYARNDEKIVAVSLAKSSD